MRMSRPRAHSSTCAQQQHQLRVPTSCWHAVVAGTNACKVSQYAGLHSSVHAAAVVGLQAPDVVCVGLKCLDLVHGVVVVDPQQHVIGATHHPLLACNKLGRANCTASPNKQE